jgi:hypothetical protein
MVTKEFLTNFADSFATEPDNKDFFIKLTTALHGKWVSFGQTLHNAGRPKMIGCF